MSLARLPSVQDNRLAGPSREPLVVDVLERSDLYVAHALARPFDTPISVRKAGPIEEAERRVLFGGGEVEYPAVSLVYGVAPLDRLPELGAGIENDVSEDFTYLS